MQIYNLKNKLEYLDEVAKLEYGEWADNKEKIENEGAANSGTIASTKEEEDPYASDSL